jgi:transposase
MGRKRGVQAHIVEKYGVAQSTASRWCKAARAGGVRSLRSTKAKEAPPKMTDEQKQKLLQIITDGATAHGFDSDVWTGKRLAKVIQDEFGVAT